jgi:hypothetical protein
MTKIRDRVINKNLTNRFKVNNSKNTLNLLKRAWDDLPADFTTGERSLFIEIAERLIKADPGEVN